MLIRNEWEGKPSKWDDEKLDSMFRSEIEWINQRLSLLLARTHGLD